MKKCNFDCIHNGFQMYDEIECDLDDYVHYIGEPCKNYESKYSFKNIIKRVFYLDVDVDQ